MYLINIYYLYMFDLQANTCRVEGTMSLTGLRPHLCSAINHIEPVVHSIVNHSIAKSANNSYK